MCLQIVTPVGVLLPSCLLMPLHCCTSPLCINQLHQVTRRKKDQIQSISLVRKPTPETNRTLSFLRRFYTVGDHSCLLRRPFTSICYATPVKKTFIRPRFHASQARRSTPFLSFVAPHQKPSTLRTSQVPSNYPALTFEHHTKPAYLLHHLLGTCSSAYLTVEPAPTWI